MPKSLSSFLDEIAEVPGELSRVSREINPDAFEVTAILEHLDQKDDLATVLFENPLVFISNSSCDIRLFNFCSLS